jgi:hypothetical protein
MRRRRRRMHMEEEEDAHGGGGGCTWRMIGCTWRRRRMHMEEEEDAHGGGGGCTCCPFVAGCMKKRGCVQVCVEKTMYEKKKEK